MYEVSEKMIGEVKKVIVGKDDIIEKIWIAILAQGHVLLEDVPGVGKTTMALSFAKALGLEVKRVQFTPDTMPSDITGFSVFSDGALRYQAGAVMTNLLLADEINRTSPKTQSALLEAMEEGRVTVDGKTYALPAPFIVLATQNPIGSAGTQNLPNSQLDRFLLRLSMGYPDRAEQVDILKHRHSGDPLDAVETVMTRETLAETIAAAEKTFVSDAVYDYIAALTEATRTHPMVQLGVSPRGALALCRAAKARAFAGGRDFALPEDVQAMARCVFAHRLLLSAKARLNERSAEDVLDEVLRAVPVPQLPERRK
ncbi:MAG: AAA family ATPase [Faecousia sp.]